MIYLGKSRDNCKKLKNKVIIMQIKLSNQDQGCKTLQIID